MAVLKYAAEMVREENISITLKFLDDESISGKVVSALRKKGIDAVPIKELTSGLRDLSLVFKQRSKQREIHHSCVFFFQVNRAFTKTTFGIKLYSGCIFCY